MTIKSLLNYESNKFENIQLPNTYKKIGFGLAIFAFVLLFINAFSINDIGYREIIKYCILIGLLIVSISKEKIEDELVTKLRMQSYTFSFIVGVIYTLVMPFMDYFFDVIFKNGNAFIKDMGDFQVLWMLLFVQVFYFEKLKRSHK